MIAPVARKLRVMHVLHDLGAGGAERIVCDLARARGAEMELATVCLDGYGALADEARALGVELFCTQRRDGFDLRQVTRIARLIRQFRPDVIHSHHYTPYLYTALAASYAGFGPIIFTEHGRHWPDVVSPIRRAVNQLLRLRRDRVVAVCDFIADALRLRERIASRDVRIIPNGVVCALYDRPRRPEWLAGLIGAPPRTPILLQVGRLHSIKDHATSIRAFAQAMGAHGGARLVLAGEGPEAQSIHSLIRELGLEQAVHCLGLRGDIPDLLASADIFVSSSLSEGACLAILEAMAAGLPVAATDVGGNRELVLHGRTGLLSPARDVSAMAASFRQLLEQSALRERMGQAGRQRAVRLYDQSSMHQAYMDLYRQLAGGTR